MTGMGTNRGASTAADGAGGLGQGFDRDQQQVLKFVPHSSILEMLTRNMQIYGVL